MRKPSIAVDLGGTIEDSWAAKRTWFAVRGFDLGARPRSRADIIKDIGGDDALYQQMVAEVYDEANILTHDAVDGVTSAVRTLAKQFSVTIVSTRAERHRRVTLGWLGRQGIGEFVAEVVLLGTASSKLEWCLNAGAVAMIDDDIRHLELPDSYDAITLIHFSPNATRPQRTIGVVTANNWEEVVRILDHVRISTSLMCQ